MLYESSPLSCSSYFIDKTEKAVMVARREIDTKALDAEHSVSLPAWCPYQGLTDQQLWAQFKSGDRGAFASIYQQHFAGLYNYGLKIQRSKELVKDQIQELFIALWDRREHLGETNAIKLYLYTSLRRRLTDQLNSKHPFHTAQVVSDHYHFEFVHSIESQMIMDLEHQHRNEKLLRSLNQLSQRQKEAIFLRYYENMSCADIAAVMGIQVNSTYVLLSQALDLLRKLAGKLILLILPFLYF
jgi:RNA polymerase sigma factor (sigma-70 family)